MPQQEISVVLKAVTDKNSVSRAVKEMQDNLKGKDARKEIGINDVDIRTWRKMNDEINRLTKNLQQMNGILQKMAKGGTPGTPGTPGGGGGGTGGSGGGGGLSGLFGRMGSANARWVMSSLMSMFTASRMWGFVNYGRDLIQSEEDYASRLGTRIGGYGSDFRRTRLQFNAIADRYAYDNMTAMRVADTYMSIAGTRNLPKNVSDILYASRGLGLDPNSLAQFFGTFGKMGGTNIKQFAEELTSAINKSGMRGREDELLSAVKQLADSAYQTQLSVKNQQWNNITGLMTYFASKDSSLRGDKGAQVIGGLDTLMRNGLNNPELLALMGYGSRYKGLQGLWQLQTRLAKGITGDTQNLRDLIIGLNQWFADPNLAKEWLLQNTNLSPDAINVLMRPDIQRDILSGKLSSDQLNKLIKGGDLNKRVQDWMKSNAAARARWQNSYKQDVAKSAADPIDQIITSAKKEIMQYIPHDAAGGIVDLLLGGSAIHTGISVWNTLKNWFRKTPPKGGGGGGKSFLDNPWEGLSDFVKGIGDDIGSILVMPKQVMDLFNQSITNPNVAMGRPQLMQTAMTYAYGWGSRNFVPAFGWGSLNFRTLEARQDDLLQKEMNVLRKREDLLNKEAQMSNTESTNNQNTLSLLEKVSYRLSDGMKDALTQVSAQTTNTMTNFMQLAFQAFSGGGGGGLNVVQTAYGGGGSGGNFLNMPLNDGFNMTPAQVNAWINQFAPPGSAMRGQGAAFVEAAQRTGLDVRYLVAHAALETGWGTSHIAKTKNNFFGIGAVDWNPYGGAYTFGNSAAAGIIGGAEWIAKNYTNRGQNTLYSMAHGGSHTYASDPTWDEKIAKIMATAPTATINVNVSGGVNGLTYANNDMVARSIANAFQNVDLSRVFLQGQRGVLL